MIFHNVVSKDDDRIAFFGFFNSSCDAGTQDVELEFFGILFG